MNILRALSIFLLCTGFAIAPSAHPQDELDVTPMTAPTTLKLINGWTTTVFGTHTPGVEIINGIVHFRGAISTTNYVAEPFILPAAFRPKQYVDVPVDLCGGSSGRLLIEPTGDVYIGVEKDFSNAQCFTSLEGASFALNNSGYTALSLTSGWLNAPEGTRAAGVKNIDGIVHFIGAVATASNSETPFKLPKGFRPEHTVYVPVGVCDNAVGRLIIQPSGDVIVQAESGSTTGCITDLDGAFFMTKDSSFHTLSLTNGWKEYSSSTNKAKVVKTGGVVYFEGAISTTANNEEPFVLPSSFIPSKTVYIPLDMCGSSTGRMIIQTHGVVVVQAETSFSNAQCFTSLEGASFLY